jgi:hypothetical protein
MELLPGGVLEVVICRGIEVLVSVGGCRGGWWRGREVTAGGDASLEGGWLFALLVCSVK